MTPEQKEKMRIGRENAKNKKLEGSNSETSNDFVSKNDFDSFKNSVVGILETISNKLNNTESSEPARKVLMATTGPENVNVPSVEISNEEVVHNLGYVSQEYDNIFDKYFDKADGFKAMLKGVNLKIEVPAKLSNAQEAHLKFYRHDIRHKVLDGHDVAGSLEKYCKLVAQNLNYKRNVRLKI
ncbi:MAG: hypothetical protein WC735_04830 [Candidatus Paceibacterota bacterium]|jgi:hypothetical protein